MEKIKNFFNKYGMISVIFLILVMSMQNCSKNGKIKRLTKERDILQVQNDSLQTLIPTENNMLIIQYKAEFGVYNKLNNEMSKLNRQEQMMSFQNQFIIPPKEELENKINELEK
jgi:hypothetical protein